MPANTDPAPAATPAANQPTTSATPGPDAALPAPPALSAVDPLRVLAELLADRQASRERDAELHETLRALALRATGQGGDTAPKPAIVDIFREKDPLESPICWFERMESHLDFNNEVDEKRRLYVITSNLRGAEGSWARALVRGPTPAVTTTEEFRQRLTAVCDDLARQLQADAEGASHDISIQVENGKVKVI